MQPVKSRAPQAMLRAVALKGIEEHATVHEVLSIELNQREFSLERVLSSSPPKSPLDGSDANPLPPPSQDFEVSDV